MRKLLVLAFLFVPMARADTYHITGATNTPVCEEIGIFCSNVSFSFTATTEPFLANYLLITNLTGVINGQQFTIAGNDGILVAGVEAIGPMPLDMPSNLPQPIGGTEVRFLFNGEMGHFLFDDYITGSEMLVSPNLAGAVTWNAVTPEPNTLILLSLPCIVLLGIYYGTRIYNWHSPL